MIRHERLNNSLNMLGKKISTIWDGIRKCLLTGVLVIVPVAVTLYIIYFIFQFADGFLRDLFSSILGISFPGFGLVLTALICLLVGVIAQYYVGRKLIDSFEKLLSKIPFVNSVYGGIKQVADVFISNSKANFKRVVMFEFPREGCWSIGFVTADFVMKVKGDLKEKDNMVTVFVPTTPNPTSGYLLILPKTKIIDMDIDIEDAMKVIISGGLVQTPSEKVVEVSAGDDRVLKLSDNSSVNENNEQA